MNPVVFLLLRHITLYILASIYKFTLALPLIMTLITTNSIVIRSTSFAIRNQIAVVQILALLLYM